MAFHPAPGCRRQGIGIVDEILILNPFQQDAQALTGPVPTQIRNAAVIDEILRTDRHGLCQHGHILAKGFCPFRIRVRPAAADDIADGQRRRLADGFSQFFCPVKRPLQGFAAKPLVDVPFSRIGKK